MSLLDFKTEIANTLIRYGNPSIQHRGRPSNATIAAQSRKRRKVVVEPSIDLRFDETSHWPEATQDRLRCILCKSRNKFTSFGCSKCHVPLCLLKDRNCFKKYHC